MHPSFNQQMSKQHMEALQHEAAAAQCMSRANSDLVYETGSGSLTRILWYLLFGMHIPTPTQKYGEVYPMHGPKTDLNVITRVVGLVALGLGLLIGGFLYSNFGLVPIVLLASIILVVVSLPILMRSASALSRHNQVPSHR
jgi:hypothetical protein